MPLGEGRQSCPHQKIPWSPQRLGQSDGCARFPGRFIYIYIQYIYSIYTDFPVEVIHIYIYTVASCIVS